MTKHLILPAHAGLGNQLYQLAAGVYFSEYPQRLLLIDRSWYFLQQYRPRRNFGLHHFCLPEEWLQPRFDTWLFSTAFWILTRTLGNRAKHFRFFQNWIIDERMPPCARQEFPDGRFLFLSGYWQNIFYFQSVQARLAPYLKPRNPLPPETEDIARLTAGSQACFVHVRRGDFLQIGHPVLGKDYYEKATEFILATTSSPRWVVFSDDIPWCREQLKLPQEAFFVDYQHPDKDFWDLHLMAQCRFGIMANSSYSAWAGLLGNTTGRCIVAPQSPSDEANGIAQRVPAHWHLIKTQPLK